MNWNDIFQYKDGELYWKIKIKKAKPGMIAGDRDAYGYRRTTYMGKAYKVHRIIWEMHFGPICGNFVIDHINRVVDDNRIENLRLASWMQNSHNRSKTIRSKSGFKGVYPCEKNSPNRPWFSTIMSKGKRIHLGSFKTKEEARDAYLVASKKYHAGFYS